MKDTAFKLYERSCGKAGFFVILEIGQKCEASIEHPFPYHYEGLSLFGHYEDENTYDETYVSSKILDDGYFSYSSIVQKQKLLLKECGVKIDTECKPLEEMVEMCSSNAKNAVYNQFLANFENQLFKEMENRNTLEKKEQMEFYSNNHNLWKEIPLNKESKKKYEIFFNDVKNVLKSENIQELEL